MEKFETTTAVTAVLREINIDTDKIIPKQYLKTIQRTGLGKGLFSELRYNDDGTDNKDFILNQPSTKNVEILISGDNFGCGSSREHAPWALLDYGIKIIISTSFADIFYGNCFKNGMLPIVLDSDQVNLLMEDASRGANAKLKINLEDQEITTSDGLIINFKIDKFLKHCLLNGLDDIDLTLEKAKKIDSYEKKIENDRPWV
ncbi:3-isopropylmalate dehydratase small subunit [Hyphomicrobiales bacterium]|jgi:3-isopropylmalate/(R)-2-methylmalate dehydratase small subunit|nr:3-isopropylmalate dehydratase small subunit [Hyphomicrobiales bacterium]|tara:strand:+ start:1378 stop:1983 length:606 start_codon:yes stop_codon:yes gene_type:complete